MQVDKKKIYLFLDLAFIGSNRIHLGNLACPHNPAGT
jgi:hypothetical protein